MEQSRNTAAKPEQPQSEPVSTADPVIVGTRLTIDGRQFEVDSVDDHTQNVSLRDVTFEAGTGFPIFRKESIDYVRAHMEQPDMVRETTAPQTDEPPAVLTPPKKKSKARLPIRWTRMAGTTASPMTTLERAHRWSVFSAIWTRSVP